MVAQLQAIATAMQDIVTLVPQVTADLTAFSAFLGTL